MSGRNRLVGAKWTESEPEGNPKAEHPLERRRMSKQKRPIGTTHTRKLFNLVNYQERVAVNAHTPLHAAASALFRALWTCTADHSSPPLAVGYPSFIQHTGDLPKTGVPIGFDLVSTEGARREATTRQFPHSTLRENVQSIPERMRGERIEPPPGSSPSSDRRLLQGNPGGKPAGRLSGYRLRKWWCFAFKHCPGRKCFVTAWRSCDMFLRNESVSQKEKSHVMRIIVLLSVVAFFVLPGLAQDVESLGGNPETGLEEIRVNLPGMPEGAVPLEMVRIPAGTFTMGSPPDERGRYYPYNPQEYDWPSHEVTLPEGFYLGQYEVTQAQWEAVMDSAPSHNSFGQDGQGDDYPVYYVSWDDCQTFVDNLNGLGLGTFRLPTEAEWEYACRAGTNTRFSFSDALECDDLGPVYCELMDRYMWWQGNDTYSGKTHGTMEVGLKLPNPWGLYDMHGSMWEVCSDWWEDPSERGPQVDPQGPPSGSARVLRGGYWYAETQYCRSASRYSVPPGGRSSYIGLRLLMEYESVSNVKDFTRY